MTADNVTILGIGAYLPPTVRTNAYWPDELVDEWRKRRSSGMTRPVEAERQISPASLALAKVMASYREDPFEGAVERRVISDDMMPSDMEIAAGRDAIARAGVNPDEIDAVLVGGTIPDYQQNSNACRVHAELGLRPGCLSVQTEGACNAFSLQVALGSALIRSGQARHVLAVQSSAQSRILRRQDPFSAWFGDGATAVVLGGAAAGHGLIGHATVTDGRFYGSLVCGVPGKRWHDGTNTLYLESPKMAREQLFAIAEHANPLLDQALAQAGLGREDISVIATHQAAAWFGPAMKEIWNLPNTRRADTFPFASSLAGGNLPLVLATEEREGLLKPGDVVATVSGATGMTMSVLLFRWTGTYNRGS